MNYSLSTTARPRRSRTQVKPKRRRTSKTEAKNRDSSRSSKHTKRKSRYLQNVNPLKLSSWKNRPQLRPQMLNSFHKSWKSRNSSKSKEKRSKKFISKSKKKFCNTCRNFWLILWNLYAKWSKTVFRSRLSLKKKSRIVSLNLWK